MSDKSSIKSDAAAKYVGEKNEKGDNENGKNDKADFGDVYKDMGGKDGGIKASKEVFWKNQDAIAAKLKEQGHLPETEITDSGKKPVKHMKGNE